MTQTPASQIPAVKSILENAKGIFPDPYPWQINVWEYIFAAKSQDVLIISGMGSGKSLCFQLLHFVKEGGITFVISPLTALMQDQVL
jgi:superfamily II DNA helicase RecQ